MVLALKILNGIFLKREMERRLKGSTRISSRKQGRAVLTNIVPLNQLTQK